MIKHYFILKIVLLSLILFSGCTNNEQPAIVWRESEDIDLADTKIFEEKREKEKADTLKSISEAHLKCENISPTLSYVERLTDPGVIWLKEPQKLSKMPDVFIDLPPEDSGAYKIGTDNGDDIILVVIHDLSEMGSYIHQLLFIKDGESYTRLYNPPDNVPNDYKEYVKEHIKNIGYSGIELNDKILIKEQKYLSTSSPSCIKIKNNYFGNSDFYFDNGPAFFSDFKKDTNYKIGNKFSNTKFGELYTVSYPVNGTVKDFSYQFLVLKGLDGRISYYRPSLDLPYQITWNNGSQAENEYYVDLLKGGGCNAVMGVPVLENLNGLEKAGITNDNNLIYKFKDLNNPIIQILYDTSIKKLNNVSLKEFVNDRNIVVMVDSLGENLILINDKYTPFYRTECGKPVIYLYPETKQYISLQVDADITKSEPEYNNGWFVSADPSGELTMPNGEKYDSLFWEGIGQEYPEITEGFIVPKNEISTTLRKHLKQLGLNEEESNDFMEFWEPKMPDTPYTRLTWFDTEEVNRLAPIRISLKPDTVIRIFLDFEGLDAPITLPEQVLSYPERKGFILVEWGGLLKIPF